jgi:sugar phosphate permease
MPLIQNLLCESLPIKFRSFYMVLTGASFNLGAIFLNSTMYMVMPNLEKEKLHNVILLVSLPNLIFAIILFFKLEESPRNLIINNREEEGFFILEKMIYRKLNEEEKNIISTQIKEGGENKNMDRSFRSIFNDKYRLITIILICLWVVNSFIVYGGSIALSLILKFIEEKNAQAVNAKKSTTNSNIIKDQILIYVISVPGSLIAAYMTESKMFGRKMTIFTGFLFIAFFSICAILNIKNFHIYFGLSGLFIALSFSGVSSYSSEVYPTKVRDLAVGLLYFCTRISGFSSQFLAVWLFKIYYLGQTYVCIALCCVACVLTLMLPYDTHGKALDSDGEEMQDKKLNNNRV